MPLPTWLQYAAALGDALAGVALLVVIWQVFVRDRRQAAREQVDQVSAWTRPVEAEMMRAPGQPHQVEVKVAMRNASALPVQIVHVGVDIRSTWMVPDDSQTDERVETFKPVDGLKASSIFIGGFRLAPGETQEQVSTIDVSDQAPARSWMLSTGSQGIACDFRTILVIDNAGRRWRLRPGRSGPARRVPRGRRREDEYEPRYW